jgi:hypothetical protein
LVWSSLIHAIHPQPHCIYNRIASTTALHLQPHCRIASTTALHLQPHCIYNRIALCLTETVLVGFSHHICSR